MLSSIPPLQDDEEDVYGVESLITNILIQETVNYIIEQFYVHKKLMPICLKLIFRRLLITFAIECTFKFNNRSLKQVDGCTMGGPLSVTFSDIYMVKMENDVVDDTYSRQKLGDNVLFDQLNSYYPNIKLTIEVNPSKFLDTKLTNISGSYIINSMFIRKTQNYLHHGPPKLQNTINEIRKW